MKHYLLELDQQIEEGLALGRALKIPKSYAKIKQVLFYGMGGSAISGNVLQVLVAQRSRDFFAVEHGGSWPHWAGPETLAVFSSYSGNTGEVLEKITPQVLKSKISILTVTSGGRLSEIAKENNLPCLRIPSGMPPRCAIGYLTFSVLPVLEKLGRFRVPDAEIKETLNIIRDYPQIEARKLAKKLKGKSTHFYGISGLMEPVLVRWRAQFAENAKTLASHHFLPEIFHNEIEGWCFPKDIIRKSAAVFLTDSSDPAFIRSKRAVVEALMRRRGAEVLEVQSKGKSVLARIFSLIALGDWVSYELALLNGVDPLDISAIEAIKKLDKIFP